MLVGVIVALALDPGVLRQLVYPVGTPAQGDLPQCRQVLDAEKVGGRPLGLRLPVDLAFAEPVQQLLGLDIH